MTSSVSIDFRLANPRDAAAISAVHDAAWRSAYRGVIPHLDLERMIARRGPQWWLRQLEAGSHITVLVFDGVVQGYASAGRARGAWPFAAGEIFELYLSPAFQGTGLGKRLFTQVRQNLRVSGLDRLVVWALENNEVACAFYAALGGKPTTVASERFSKVTLTRIAYTWGVNVTTRREPGY